MKTAMQELIDKVEHAISYNVEGGLVEKYTWTELFNDMELAIQKEKEQIMKAYCDGFHELLPFHQNEYYNQTYNQNK